MAKKDRAWAWSLEGFMVGIFLSVGLWVGSGVVLFLFLLLWEGGISFVLSSVAFVARDWIPTSF